MVVANELPFVDTATHNKDVSGSRTLLRQRSCGVFGISAFGRNPRCKQTNHAVGCARGVTDPELKNVFELIPGPLMVFIQREIGLTFGSGARLITGTATKRFQFL